jgi:hypothetical protein
VIARAGLAAVAVASLAGCGTDPALRRADDTVHVALQVAGEAEGTLAAAERNEQPSEALSGARTALERLRTRLDEAEQTISIWFETGAGKLSWHAIAPCLAGTLRGLGTAFDAASLPQPENLDQAAVMAEEGTSDRCADVE